MARGEEKGTAVTDVLFIQPPPVTPLTGKAGPAGRRQAGSVRHRPTAPLGGPEGQNSRPCRSAGFVAARGRSPRGSLAPSPGGTEEVKDDLFGALALQDLLQRIAEVGFVL